MKIHFLQLSLLLILLTFSCSEKEPETKIATPTDYKFSTLNLNLAEANRLSKLPINCIQSPLPYKAGHVIAKASDLNMPQNHHPAFYGCFDWHSAVHGHWSLVYLLKEFPELEDQAKIRKMLLENLSAKNIQKEVEYFSMNKYTKNFERTYGWTWVLKLAEELYTWDDPDAKILYKNLQPLCDYINKKYIEYLPKLVYPIRVGEHSNTAFGISFAYDYAITTKQIELQKMIELRANDFYLTDAGCPLDWEPSGYDFLSPCFEEAYIMSRVLKADKFKAWFNDYLPGMKDGEVKLEPAKVSDRSDGKLVHLDGLNFSRAWCLYSIGKQLDSNGNMYRLADEHLTYSLSKITDGDYMGEHWLASFALYAFKAKKEAQKK